MKYRDAVLGLVVLVLLIGLGIWARQRSHAAPGATAGPAVSGGIPDVTTGPAVLDAGGGVRIAVALDPSPPVSMTPFRVRVRAERDGAPLDLTHGRVSFEMTMPMGDHRYDLQGGADGWQTAEAVLPACASGGRRWFATIEGDVAGRPRVVKVRLDLARPS